MWIGVRGQGSGVSTQESGATENFVVSWCGKAASALLQGRGALATSHAPKSLTTDP